MLFVPNLKFSIWLGHFAIFTVNCGKLIRLYPFSLSTQVMNFRSFLLKCMQEFDVGFRSAKSSLKRRDSIQVE